MLALVHYLRLLSGALLGLSGYILGGGAALLARMSRPQVGFLLQRPVSCIIHFTFQIIAVAIETAIQNGGIAVVVINMAFPR